MKKKALFYIIIVVITMFLSTENVSAKEFVELKNAEKYETNIVVNEGFLYTGNLVQIADCSGQNAVLGNVNDPDSVAWLLQKLLDYARLIGPFIVLIMSSLDYLKAVLNSDDDSLKKANKKLVTRLILIVALFLLPTSVSVLLNVLGFTSHEVCGLQ